MQGISFYTTLISLVLLGMITVELGLFFSIIIWNNDQKYNTVLVHHNHFSETLPYLYTYKHFHHESIISATQGYLILILFMSLCMQGRHVKTRTRGHTFAVVTHLMGVSGGNWHQGCKQISLPPGYIHSLSHFEMPTLALGMLAAVLTDAEIILVGMESSVPYKFLLIQIF